MKTTKTTAKKPASRRSKKPATAPAAHERGGIRKQTEEIALRLEAAGAAVDVPVGKTEHTINGRPVVIMRKTAHHAEFARPGETAFSRVPLGEANKESARLTDEGQQIVEDVTGTL